MSIQPVKATCSFFNNLGNLCDVTAGDILPILMQIAWIELLKKETDCLLPLHNYKRQLGKITPCFEGEVYTRRVNAYLSNGKDAEKDAIEFGFVYSHSAPMHTDYEAFTHLLILQADNHTLRIDDLDKDFSFEVGDIIQFNIDTPHALIAGVDTEFPFVALSYDVYTTIVEAELRQYPALNRKTAIPFFQDLVEEIVSNA